MRPRRAAWAWALALGLGACEAKPAVASAPGVVDLEGNAVDPLRVAMSRDELAVLVFVGTRCPISNRYAPTLSALAERWSDAPVRAWLVYPDPDDDAAAIATHVSAYGLRWPAVRDPAHTLAARAGATVTPEAAVFAPRADAPAYHGRIDDRVVAFGNVRKEASRHDVRDAVDALLRHEAPPSPTEPAIGCYISDLR